MENARLTRRCTGNVADGIYILIQGKCRIVKASEEGGEDPELSLSKFSWKFLHRIARAWGSR
jgi:hypothetical protein